jgi:hypothetical protein
MLTATVLLCLALLALMQASTQMIRQPIKIERHKKAPDHRGY